MRVDILPQDNGKTLLEVLSKYGFKIKADCAGRGKCKKCKVRIVSGSFMDIDTKKEILQDKNGYILSCRALCGKDPAVVELDDALEYKFKENLSGDNYSPTDICAAFDIGTTTLEAVLIDTITGKIVLRERSINPQINWGADVVSRIDACASGKLELLSSAVQLELNSMLKRMLDRINFKGDKISQAAVAGNTTMLHIFCSVSPCGMGTFPFTPEFLDMQVLKGKSVGLDVDTVTTLPSISAYIGADITAGMLTANMDQLNRPTPAILIDIGTNGEMVLDTPNGFFAASTAAGPAFEGAHISCGTGAVPGAINHVYFENGKFSFTTIESQSGNIAPVSGICGAGLVEWIALLLKYKIIDNAGNFNMPAVLCRGISLTDRDIREFQLAKSAMRAGIETLILEAGYTASDISKVYISGALGYFINKSAAVEVGLFPKEFIGKIETLGNSSITGAVKFLCDLKSRKSCLGFTQSCKLIELSNSNTFSDLFMEYIAF